MEKPGLSPLGSNPMSVNVFEVDCQRCGACCWTESRVPCSHLRFKDGKCICSIYPRRFELMGNKCVSIIYLISKGWGPSKCVFQKHKEYYLTVATWYARYGIPDSRKEGTL
jgi:uncharacterized cysteine cluster protein YcgN (CxxCxxCC family)